MYIVILIGVMVIIGAYAVSRAKMDIAEEDADDDTPPWRNEPITNKQKNVLKLFGRFRGENTKGDASEVIDEIFKDPINKKIWGEYLDTTGLTGDEPQLASHDFDQLRQAVVSRMNK